MFFIEIKRAFSRLSFKIAISIGVIFCILSLIEMPVYRGNVMDSYIKGFINTPFSNFMLFRLNVISNFLIIIMPIISTLSYSDSYIEDVKSGFIKSIYTREKKYSYLIAKYFANFIISGIAFSIPLLLNYIILILLYPSIQPDPILSGVTIMKGGLFPQLFYSHSNIYIIMWITIYFLYSAAFASIALCFSKLLKHKFVILFTPFVLYFLVEVFAEISNKMEYSPQAFLYLSLKQDFFIILSEFIFIFVITFIIFCFGGSNDEIY